MDGYFYIDEPKSGALNMALDRRLVEMADAHRCALVRVYQWNEPTLSLGHFQPIELRQSHPESLSIACVRRKSGGGAIVHHHEWTYAVAMPGTRYRTGAATELYDCVHDALVRWLRQLGWRAEKWRAAENASCDAPSDGCGATANCRDFLCFQRRSPGDVVVGESKVLGSAQRRFGSSVLQHGSLLLRRSPHAPALPGILDLKSEDSQMDSLPLGRHEFLTTISTATSEIPMPRVSAGFKSLDLHPDTGKELSVRIAEGLCPEFGVNFAALRFDSELAKQLALQDPKNPSNPTES